MKFLLALVIALSAFTFSANTQPDDGLRGNTETGTTTTVTVESYSGGNYGPSFTNELKFVETFLESNYILFLALIIAIIGFWQFFVLSNGFGLVMIVLAIGLTAFPGVYKGFYAGTRSFVHEAAGTTETQGWE